jgi:hypothetical protein
MGEYIYCGTLIVTVQYGLSPPGGPCKMGAGAAEIPPDLGNQPSSVVLHDISVSSKHAVTILAKQLYKQNQLFLKLHRCIFRWDRIKELGLIRC